MGQRDGEDDVEQQVDEDGERQPRRVPAIAAFDADFACGLSGFHAQIGQSGISMQHEVATVSPETCEFRIPGGYECLVISRRCVWI